MNSTMSDDNPLNLPAHVKTMPHEEKRLRKEWLKRKFGSFEYHEEMLRLHHQWVEAIRRALARGLKDPSPDPDYGTKAAFAKNFEETDWALIQANDDLGKYSKDDWDRYRHTATFRSIPDYSRYLLSEGDRLGWMTDNEHIELGKYWKPMARMAQNIAYTVDERWEEDPDDADWMLDEKYTGPVNWPDDWRSEIATLGRIKAGEPVPLGGLWQAVDSQKRQVRASTGDRLPNLGSAYGITLWERVGD